VKSSYLSWTKRFAVAGAGLVLLLVFALACTFVYLAPTLPTAETVRNKEKEFAVPLRVYTQGGELVSQFGEQRRIPITYEDLPPVVVHAVLAAEDDGFFQHSGVDWLGLLRAMLVNLKDMEFSEGGSTITQQAARNMFLSLDKHLRRKAAELFVTWRMEHDFTKQEILATYLNVINFGNRSYGIAAAAETYYGKKLPELTVGQAATLAGIIQRPSTSNPVKDPNAAQARRHYVLGRMTKLGYIDKATAEAAEKEPVGTRRFALLTDVEADYVAEMVRLDLIKRYGPAAVNAGYKVYTTLDATKQSAANMAVRQGLMDYDQRHGWRGRLGKVDLSANPSADELEARLEKFRSVATLLPAIVTRVTEPAADVYVRDQGAARIAWEDMSWIRPGSARKALDVLKRGDVVYVVVGKPGTAKLSQLPQAQAALVALDPRDGAIVSLVGGFDFYTSSFNRVTQARRQPGSGFKPFLYSAALENGYTASYPLINDMPIVFDMDSNSEEQWKPENSSGDFKGPMRLREALVQSRNLVSARIVQAVGVGTVIDYASKFGFDPATLPRDPTLALGTLVATPLQMATGYAVFANGGFKVDPYLVTRIEDASGKVVFEAQPKIACLSCEQPDDAGSTSVPEDRRAPRVISVQNAWLMSDIMHDVATRGTGRRTNELGRDDLAGKTGTTQNSRDNWWNGFNANLVATAWVGFDDERSLGEKEEGSSTAVPLWMYFMKEALKGTASSRMPRPEGLIDIRVSASTGEPVGPSEPGINEIFMEGHLPSQVTVVQDPSGPGSAPTIVVKPTGNASGDLIF
jgi:penicillin-binding protein 1A